MFTTLTRILDRRWYPQCQGAWDNIIFRNAILKVVGPQSRVLDLGAGAGILPQMNFRGQVSKVYGIDLDERVVENAHLDYSVIGTAEHLPYRADFFDVVICNNVLEHLSDPLPVFAEAARVLRPDGIFMFKTPNKWHYVAVFARIFPHRIHELINYTRGRKRADNFPTLYRANTAGQITSAGAAAGLTITSLDFIEARPEYLRLCPLTYAVGWLYERVVNSTECLHKARVIIMGTLRKTNKRRR